MRGWNIGLQLDMNYTETLEDMDRYITIVQYNVLFIVILFNIFKQYCMIFFYVLILTTNLCFASLFLAKIKGIVKFELYYIF